jgi:hypothetical protein
MTRHFVTVMDKLPQTHHSLGTSSVDAASQEKKGK